MNVERLKHLSAYLRDLPDDNEVGFNMADWWVSKDEEADEYSYCEEPVDYRGHDCKTAGCLAAHAVNLFSVGAWCTLDIEKLARELLGLTSEQAYYLFTPRGKDMYKLTPQDAANAIDRLLQGAPQHELWRVQ